MAKRKSSIYKSSRGTIIPAPKRSGVNDLPAPLLFVLGVGGFALGVWLVRHRAQASGLRPQAVGGFRPYV